MGVLRHGKNILCTAVPCRFAHTPASQMTKLQATKANEDSHLAGDLKRLISIALGEYRSFATA